MSVPDDQVEFRHCIQELVKSLPETKKAISAQTGVSVSAIDNLLSSKAPVEASDLHKLLAYFNCRYELGMNYEGSEFHDFRLGGGYTVMPKGKRRIVTLYDSVSNGGDLVFAYHLVQLGGYRTNHTRYILLHTCYHHYTLMIIKNQADVVDQLIDNGALINFSGDRVACTKLFRELQEHEHRLECEPQNRREIDREFFANKHLVFAQLAPSFVVTE